MSSRKSSWITMLSLLCYIYYAGLTDAKTHYRYMTNYCSKSIQVVDSLVLSLTMTDNLADGRDRDFVHCDVDLLAPAGMRLYAHFLQLGISPEVSHSDRLQLYDLASNNTRLTPIKGLYGKLDRTLSLFDNSGIQVSDYRTVGNKLKVDYLGKPTKKSPGFRLLITNFHDPGSSGECPTRHYRCSQSRICIPRQTTCDGNSNCGKDDAGDEKGCDRFDTVTNLLVEYSLTRDIIVVILLPLFIFISFVIITYLMAKRYIREKINKPALPSVHYSPQKGGQVRFEEVTERHAPPAYEDLMHMSKRYDPPPAYSGLSFSADEGCTRADGSVHETSENIYKEDKGRERQLNSISTEDKNDEILEMDPGSSEYENYRLHCVWPSDTDEDDEIKKKRRKKGGKGKVKGRKKEIQGNISKSSLSCKSTPANSSNTSVPSNDNAVASADSFRTSASSTELPQNSISLAATCTQSDITSLGKPVACKASKDFIPIQVTPNNYKHSMVACDGIAPPVHRGTDAEKNGFAEEGSKTVITSPLAAEKISTKDPSCNKVCSSIENSTNSINKSNVILSKHGNVIVNRLQIDDDQDADISGDSDGGTTHNNQQKAKVASTFPKNKIANGHIARV